MTKYYTCVIDIKKLRESTQNYKKQMYKYGSFITSKYTCNVNFTEIIKPRKKISFRTKISIRYYNLSINEINDKKQCWQDIKNNRIKLLIK